MMFDHEEQDSYNREVGVPVTAYEEHGSGWLNLLLASQAEAAHAETMVAFLGAQGFVMRVQVAAGKLERTAEKRGRSTADR